MSCALGWAVCSLGALTVGLHVGLLGSGQWQGDEFFNFAMYRQRGVSFLLARVGGWSPRPLSEAALYLYARAGLGLHRPLIVPMLALCWLALFGAVLLAWRPSTVPNGWAAVAALCGMLLLGHPVSEMFYWPMAAAPYLGCLGAISFVVLRLAQRGTAVSLGERAAIIAALIVAAWCAELGILFAGCLCPLLFLVDLVAFAKFRTPRRLAHAAIWGLPIVACVPLIVWVIAGRVDQPGNAAQTASPSFHHMLISLRAAAEFLPTDVTAGFSWVAMGALALFGAGLFAGFSVSRAHTPPLVLLALGAALIGAAVLSIIAAEYQLGGPCCERHATFRQCLLVLLVVVLARLLADLAPARRGAGESGSLAPLASTLLASALLAGLLPRIGALIHDYRQQPAIMDATRANWLPGNQYGPHSATFRLAPSGMLIRPGLEIAPGRYDAQPGEPWYLWGLMTYFGASAVIVLPRPEVVRTRSGTSAAPAIMRSPDN